MADRLKIFRRVRSLMAEQAEPLAHAANAARHRPLAEILTAEVLPLAEACRFLERAAEKILRPKKMGSRGRPFWLGGVHSEIHREPHGVVLVIGPGNYPLFLPGVQALQALAAGNAVLLKPGFGGSPAARLAGENFLAGRAGRKSDSSFAGNGGGGRLRHQAGMDKVVLTGSATTGEAVLQQCAKKSDAGDRRAFRLRRCFRPRRCGFGSGRPRAGVRFAAEQQRHLHRAAPRVCASQPRHGTRRPAGGTFSNERTRRSFRLRQSALVVCSSREALADGAHLRGRKISAGGRLAHADHFRRRETRHAARAGRHFFARAFAHHGGDDDEALEFAAQCPYALGATIFSRDESAARALAAQFAPVWC